MGRGSSLRMFPIRGQGIHFLRSGFYSPLSRGCACGTPSFLFTEETQGSGGDGE